MTSERKLAKSRKSRDNSPFTLIRENHCNNNDLKLAEGVGFEPTVRKAYNGFRDRPIRPLWHPSEALSDKGFRLKILT